MLHILAIMAKAGHGKSTAVKYLEERYGVKRVALAGPLKEASKIVMGFTDAQLYGTQQEKEAIDPRYGFSARHFMQKLGTEGLRECFWPTIHVEALIKKLEKEDEETDRTVVYGVDDCRFVNEAIAFADAEDYHGAVIKLVCTDAEDTEVHDHVSEREIDLVPEEALAATIYHAKADGVESLHRQIDRALSTVPKLGPFRRALGFASAPGSCL